MTSGPLAQHECGLEDIILDMTKRFSPTTRRQVHILLTHVRPRWRRVVLLSLLIVAGIALQLISPQLVRRFLDAVEQGRTLNELVGTAVIFIGVALVVQVIKLAAAYLGEIVAWSATNDLRADLALHCLKLDMAFHKSYKPGELIERVDGDVNQLANFFSQLVIQVISNLLLIAGVMVLLWLVDWRVGAMISALGLGGMLALNWFNKRTIPRWQALRQVSSDLFGYLEEWLSGTEEIQTNSAASFIMRRLYALMRLRWHSMQRAMRMNMGVMALPIVVPSLAYIVAYAWGTELFESSVLTIGSVYVIFYYIDVIKNPLWVIQRQVQDLQQASASLNRITELLDEQPTITDGKIEEVRSGPLGVEFDDVAFSYADDPNNDILVGITLQLAPGCKLGLLGRTGSGKTTLIRLLFRFYDPTNGSIHFSNDDGRLFELRQLSQTAIRQRIGMVTQEVQLFHASVRDNLTLFNDTIKDEQILEALDKLSLRPWLDDLPDGLATRLEGNESLSAGEAQLLALARVFLADPGIVILDEASSRLDPATERLLESALDRLLEGRTAIIIAHHLETVRRADEIMILGNGRILEHGERESLAGDHESIFYRLLKGGLEESELLSSSERVSVEPVETQ